MLYLLVLFLLSIFYIYLFVEARKNQIVYSLFNLVYIAKYIFILNNVENSTAIENMYNTLKSELAYLESADFHHLIKNDILYFDLLEHNCYYLHQFLKTDFILLYAKNFQKSLVSQEGNIEIRIREIVTLQDVINNYTTMKKCLY
jgi:hypothetical protein